MPPYIDREGSLRDKDYVDSEDLLQWPEFIALAKRLGIPLDVQTIKLVLTVSPGSLVIVNHEYQGKDK